jgi:outer membrane receptor for ferrienterochelin and colicins
MLKIVTLILSLSATTAFSQLALHIIDEHQIEIPFCKVTYLKNGIKQTQFTNSEGQLVLANELIKCNTNYFFIISSIGYETFHDSLSCDEEKTIVLKQNAELLGEVCVTGEYNPTTTEQSVNKITVISKDVIINSGASNLTDVLAYQTNIRIGQDNILGSKMEMGGMSGQNVKILVDGVPVIGRLDGNVDLSQINLDNVEKIEIVNGPLSVNYGTNSLAGTINIITDKKLSQGVSGSLLGYYETVGNYNLTANIAYRYKSQTLKLSGGRKYFDGWHPNDDFIIIPKETLADTNRSMQWNPKLQYIGEAQYILNLKKWQINPYFRYYTEKITNRGFPLTPYFENAFDDYYYTTRRDLGLNISKTFKKGNLKLIAGYNYYNRIKNTYINDLTTLDQSLTSSVSDQDTSIFDLAFFRTTYTSNLNRWFNFQFGIDLNQESAFGKKIKDKRQINGDYAVFSTANIKALKNKLIIKPGLRYAYNLTYTSPVTPSLNLKYTLNNINLRGSIAKGFRAPTLKELYFNFVDVNHNIQGNTDLIAENSLNYNLSATHLKQLKHNSIFKTSLSVFYNDFNNLITLGTTSDGSYTYINIGEYSTIGTQLELIYRRRNIKFSINPSIVGRENYLKSETIETYAYSPEVSSQFSYQFNDKNWGLNLFYKFNGSQNQYIVNAEDEITISTTDGYSILDFSINRKLMHKNMNIILGVKNIFNVTNVNVSGSSQSGIHSSNGASPIGRGTSVFMSVNYKFKHSKK